MADNGKYSIAVAVKTAYLAEQSDPSRNQYVFAYTITIANTGEVAAQLISRHWVITDAEHQVQEVKGAGVVGQQPLLQPGESFEYTSGTSLQTAVGTMRGSYQMVAEDGHAFDADIPLVHAFGAAHPALGPSPDPGRAAGVAASGPSSRPRRRRRSGAPPTPRGRTIPSCPAPFVRSSRPRAPRLPSP